MHWAELVAYNIGIRVNHSNDPQIARLVEVKNMYRSLLVLVLVGIVPLGAQSAAKSYSCKAPAQIQDAITQAGPGGIESLLAKYPGDFWVRRAFIDSRASGGSVAVLRSSAGIPGGPAAESVQSRSLRRTMRIGRRILSGLSLRVRTCPQEYE